ncbi:MAG: hypothetical protein RIQ81_1885 [Pseudomonadota bacterium]|jgi:uncharacterized protein (DUF58 family)
MYYRTVNRGLAFSKAGIYSLAAVFLSGLIAINTGTNALFLFLASGLSLILVSGLLSESAIRSYEVRGFLQHTAEAGKPFDIALIVENTNRHIPIYGFENYAIDNAPRSLIFPVRLKNCQGQGNVMVLPPKSSKTIGFHMEAMPRGLHKSIRILQRTNFPFGLIDKFKMSESRGYLTILPAILPDLYEELRRDYRKRVAAQDDEREFYCHKPHTINDSARYIDWRKSAGKQQRNWVQKEYRSEVAEFGIMITVDWGRMRALATAEAYERMISVIRTAAEVIKDASRDLVLMHEDRSYTSGYEPVAHFLAALPEFENRRDPWETPEAKKEIKGVFLQLALEMDGYKWGEYVSHDPRAPHRRGKTA